MTCRHKPTGVVSNQPDGYDASRPHYSRTVCSRPACIAALVTKATKVTGEPAEYRPFQTTGGLGELTTCPQVWPTGLNARLIIECEGLTGHRGWHANTKEDIRWSGKLTPDEEQALADLRETRAVRA